MISAKIIADSVNPNGDRLTTFVLEYPRFIHSELMTHRSLSKNSASSRARPVKKVIEDILRNLALPVRWGKTGSGMQDHGVLCKRRSWVCRKLVKCASLATIGFVWTLLKLGLHKQVANRYLEPYSHIRIVLSGTDWINFYKLRFHPAAQPEFQELARQMLFEHSNSVPEFLSPGEWHLPFVKPEEKLLPIEDKLIMSTARCARVSYNNFSGDSTLEKDRDTHEKLVGSSPIHASPTEHPSQAWHSSKRFGNFKGFKQYRKFIVGENPDETEKFDPIALYKELSDAIKE